jgi:zinc transporter 9
MKSVVIGVVIFSVSVSALSSAKKDDVVTVAHDEHTSSSSSSSSSDIHTLIGISLVLGFVFMLLIDQCSVSRSKGKGINLIG